MWKTTWKVRLNIRLIVFSSLLALTTGHTAAMQIERGRQDLAIPSNPLPSQAKTTPQKRPVLSVPYKMPADGELTLGLYNKDGQLVRWLTQGDFRYAGQNKEEWDGLDQYGNPAAPGNYTLKGVYHAPITTDYKMSVVNPGNPPWPTPDDKGDWLSDEYDPQAAVTDGKWVYLAAPGNELGYSIIAVDETGQRQWGIRVTTDGRATSLALSGDYLYAVYSGAALTDNTRSYTGKNAIGRAVLMCFDKRTGKPVQFTLKQPNQIVATWPYRNDYTWLDVLRNKRVVRPGGLRRPATLFLHRHRRVDQRFRSRRGWRQSLRLVELRQQAVGESIPTTGKPNGEEIHVENPVGLAPMDDHTLLAVSGKQSCEGGCSQQDSDAGDYIQSRRARQRYNGQSGKYLCRAIGPLRFK